MGKLIEKKNEKKTACRTVLFIICLVGMIFCLTGCGASEKKLKGYNDCFRNTIHLISASDTKLIPDLYHIILHLFILLNIGFVIYHLAA